jgi:alginate O-acetyltransferase complex protein AlgI
VDEGGRPVIYSNLEYVCLLVATILLFAAFTRSYRARFFVLTAASLLFYSWLSLVECLVFFFVVVFSWLFLWAANRDRERQWWWLGAGIVTMTLHLFFWKYSSWVTELIYDVNPTAMKGNVLFFPLPAGISFFTLQGIAYLVDFGRREVPMMSFRKYLLFKSFFPQLVAGPIVRARTMLPQINALRVPDSDDIWAGATLFCVGLAKKMLLADRIAPLVEPMYTNPGAYDRSSLILAGVGFTVQVWADFSGYTDMGRGSARMLGFQLPENFFAPYLSRTPSEFWRRWHVTLSTWIRDYIYFPLGGSRGSAWRVASVALFTMVLSGIWHGAAFGYVFWGIYNGAWLVMERLLRGRLPKVPAVLSWAHFFAGFVVSMMIFRSPTLSKMGQFLGGVFLANNASGTMEIGRYTILASVVAMFAYHWATYFDLDGKEPAPFTRWTAGFSLDRVATQVAYALLLGAMFSLILFFRPGAEAASFIYFKF